MEIEIQEEFIHEETVKNLLEAFTRFLSMYHWQDRSIGHIKHLTVYRVDLSDAPEYTAEIITHQGIKLRGRNNFYDSKASGWTGLGDWGFNIEE